MYTYRYFGICISLSMQECNILLLLLLSLLLLLFYYYYYYYYYWCYCYYCCCICLQVSLFLFTIRWHILNYIILLLYMKQKNYRDFQCNYHQTFFFPVNLYCYHWNDRIWYGDGIHFFHVHMDVSWMGQLLLLKKCRRKFS